MKYTNNFNLPEPIYKAILAHEHKGAKYTASGISKSIRSFILTDRHDDEIVKDVSEMSWAFFGTMLHSYLEKYGLKGNFLSEQYLSSIIAGQEFTGTSDLLCQEKSDYVIVDYKTMSVWGWVFWKDGKFNPYEVQLNAYKYLYSKCDFYAKKLKIVAFFRNWEKKKVGNGYPKIPIMEIPVKSWTLEETEDYIKTKINAFEKFKDAPEPELPMCLPEELWQSPTKYAVKRQGNKTAMSGGIKNSKEEADKFILNQKIQDKKPYKYIVEVRPGTVERCNYCDGRTWCGQYKKLKEQGLIRSY
jgi:hypothetical protein